MRVGIDEDAHQLADIAVRGALAGACVLAEHLKEQWHVCGDRIANERNHFARLARPHECLVDSFCIKFLAQKQACLAQEREACEMTLVEFDLPQGMLPVPRFDVDAARIAIPDGENLV